MRWVGPELRHCLSQRSSRAGSIGIGWSDFARAIGFVWNFTAIVVLRVSRVAYGDLMTSDRKKESNRRNAQLSTGPRSSANKAISRQSATRHGVLSENVAVSSYNPDHYYDLRESLWYELDSA